MTRSFTATMVAPNEDFDGAPRLRGEIRLEPGHGDVIRARLFATAHGVLEAYLGGRRVDDDVLSPGWSAYEWRLRYRKYDVTSLVHQAAAAAQTEPATVVVGMALGNGWWRGHLGFLGNRAVYGEELAALAELEVTYADGHVQRAGTDAGWAAGPSDTVANDLYMGQTIDARVRNDAWLLPGADLSGWVGVHPVATDPSRLTPYIGPAVRRQDVVRPQRIWAAPSGRTIVDFGQNLVGWVRLRARGEAGSLVTVRHAEVLEHDELATRPLRTAEATDRYVLSGGLDEFEPTFTFHGFRYADLEGYPGDLTADDLEAVVVHSDLPRIGTFECSEPLLNQLHSNVVWSQRGNFLDLPTDCPQRNERLGWTGDIAVFAPTAAYLYDVSGFLDDWLADLDAEQRAADGLVPFVVPDNMKYDPPPKDFPKPETTAIWSDAAAWVPWALWQAYGDRSALARHYPAMIAHTRRVESLLSPTGLWDTGFQFGDWLDPTAPPDHPLQAKADNGVVATACYVRTLDIVLRTAAEIGADDDVAQLTELRDRVRAAFNRHYVAQDGTVTSDCQTVYALAIAFDLLDGAQREAAGQRLAALVTEAGYHVATGFAGTPYVLDALTVTGHTDIAYRMLTERSCPSWLYPVTMGATSIWERWDSMQPDGSVNPGEMTSFNHYALGAVADWMHRTIAGIAPLGPGYDGVLVAPVVGGGLTWAKASLLTPHGRVAVDWARRGDTLTVRVEVAEGVAATIRLPGMADQVVEGGSHVVSTSVSAGASS
ncbi:MAG TPA: family 78 glycoside hydrolase catalytic domain [Dermatophilaceae bacterium]|nr:family 78 glycoside hydrolase catalytic domain [Dermatophilaceae bacterium]